MATFTAGPGADAAGIDFRTFDLNDFVFGATEITPTLIHLGDNTDFVELRGKFSLDSNGKVTGGTINEIETVESSTTVYEVTGLSVSIATLVSSWLDDDSEGFLRAVFLANDTLSGSATADFMSGFAGNDTIAGLGGNDELLGDVGNDSLVGGLGDDSLDGSAGNDKLVGGAGNDSLAGGADNDTLDGGEGNDTLDGGTGSVSLVGGKGDDLYIVDKTTDKLSETILLASGGGIDTVESSVSFTLGANLDNLVLTGADTITGTGNLLDNEITGNDKNSRLLGLAGKDELTGGLGDDTLDGGIGDDSMTGGEGNDLYIVDSAGDDVNETGSNLGDELRTNQMLALEAGIEHYTYTGTKAVSFAGDTKDNRITAAGLGDSLDGGDGNDTLLGLAGNDTLGGGESNDRLDGGTGIDKMTGGKGDDTYVVDNAADVIVENADEGDDTAESTLAIDLNLARFASIEHGTLLGSAALKLTGDSDGNKLTGNAGANTIDGGLGADSMAGGKGNDIFFVDLAGDKVTENAGEGTDMVVSKVDFILGDNLENLTLLDAAADGTGNVLANAITGNANDNDLSGGDANDTLTGGDGKDSLDGGAGTDSLAGGKGDDLYIVDKTADKISETVLLASGGGIDTVESSATFTLGTNLDNLVQTGTDNIDATGNTLDNDVTGNSGNNKLFGLAGKDTLTGNDGNDTLDGGTGDDSLTGGKGNDTYLLDSVNDKFSEAGGDGIDTVSATFKIDLNNAFYDDIENATLLGTAVEAIGDDGANILTGNASGNKLSGNGASDSLVGGGGNDTLDGGEGEDSLDGGTGSDSMQGGKGSDVFFVDSAADKLGDSGDASDKDQIRTSITYSLATLGFIENAMLLGVAAINLTGNTLANVLVGNDGNNKLDGGAEADTLQGGLGNDTLTGSAGGADDLVGGKGNDIYIPDADDTISEAADEGIDLVQAAFTYSIAPWDNVENLTLTGTAAIDGTGNDGKNVITGNTAANKLDGGTGTDTLVGGGGDDSYVVDDTGDKITEAAGGGTDTVFSSAAKFTLPDNVEHLTLTGGSDIDGTGNTLANKVTGNSGNNVLSGLANNDSMDGGAGTDTLNGGLGTDSYLYDVTKNGIDVVNTGDNGLDRVVLVGDDLFDWITKRDGSDLLIAAILDEADADSELDPANAIRIVNQYAGAGIAFFTGDFGEESNLFYGADKNLTTVFTPTGLNGKDQGANAEVIEGTDGNDTINGNGGQTDFLSGNKGDDAVNSQSDVNEFGFLYGGEGKDTLTGGKGRDNLRGDEGDDLLIGGDGNDRADYRGADEGVTVDLNKQGIAQFISAGQGSDTLISVEYVRGGSFNDTLTGNDIGNTLNGRDGDDVLTGNGGGDFLIGGKGNDTLDGGALDDFDEASFEDADEGVIVNLTNSTQAGVAAHTAKDGLGGIDSLIAIAGVFGSEFGDQVFGADNDEFFEPMGGDDTIDGAGGFDEIDYFSSSDGVTADLTKQGQLQVISASQGSDFFTNIEGLDGGAFNDSLTGDANDNFLSGRAGADSLQGGAGADDLRPGAGNDTVDGGADADFDRVNYFQASSGVRVDLNKLGVAQVISATEGSDTLFNIDDVLGSRFNDTLIGNSLENFLMGVAGNDSLSGGAGTDLLAGGAGNDALSGGTDFDLADYRDATSGVRVDLTKQGVAQVIGADQGTDVLTSIEDLRGSRFDDTLIGNGNDNLLIGLEGNDQMTVVGNKFFAADGGAGIDRLIVNGANFAISQQEVEEKVFAIEEIDLTGSGNNQLTLNALDVLQTSDTDAMRILGNAGDAVTSTGQGWIRGVDQIIDGQSYATYTSNQPGSLVTLLVDTDITQTIS